MHFYWIKNVSFSKLSRQSILNISRNVIWVYKSYGEYKNITDISIVKVTVNDEMDTHETNEDT
jgi:hypothetical protein